MESLKTFYDQALFLFSILTWFSVIDLLLVTAAFYFLLSLIQRSSASYLIRELLILGIGLFAIAALLPLPVFDWLIQGVLVAILVVTPIIFQAQLRRFIERVGRSTGIARAARQDVVEKSLPEIVHAVEKMAASYTGALMALEGNDPLDEFTATGITFNGRVSSEVLLSIFYSGTPLHDGAVVIRSDKIIAAGCVLPLSQQILPAEKRLGTRHRAAAGLSEVTDSLVIVVSEETGSIGVAYRGQLERPLSSAQLRERLVDFYDPVMSKPSRHFSLWAAFKQIGLQVWRSTSLTNPHQFLSNLGLFLFALLLALAVWFFVLQQNNTIVRTRIDNIPLRVENVPPDAKLLSPATSTVSAMVQTTRELVDTLSPQNFQAVVSLENSAQETDSLPVVVKTGVDRVLVLSVAPAVMNVELAPIISKTMPVTVTILHQESLPAAYQLVGLPEPNPDTVEVTGPANQVEQVTSVRAEVSLLNATTLFREFSPLQALDQEGQPVSGVTITPNRVQVTVTIRDRYDRQDASVRAVVTGTPPAAYQISEIRVEPASVILQSSNWASMTDIGSFVETLPINVDQVTTDLRVETPLNLPPNIQVLDADNNPVRTVTVFVNVAAREGVTSLTRPVELLTLLETVTGTLQLDPETVTLLLIGPQPILTEIANNPNLVRVEVDAGDLQNVGDTAVLTPQVSVPEEVEVEVVPASIRATLR